MKHKTISRCSLGNASAASNLCEHSLTSAAILEASSRAFLSSLAFSCKSSPTPRFKLSKYCFLRIRVFRACSRFLSRLEGVRQRGKSKRRPWTARDGMFTGVASLTTKKKLPTVSVNMIETRVGQNHPLTRRGATQSLFCLRSPY